jgi:trigger factor
VDPPIFEFKVSLAPKVELGDYQSIRFPYESKRIDETEVFGVLKDLQERQAVIEPVERPAQEGDLVYLRISAIRKDCTTEEVNQQIFAERPYPALIEPEGSTEDIWPFAGFSRYLIGVSAGDEKVISYIFPEDYSSENLQGVEAEYNLKVESVKLRTLPVLDDDFATANGDYATLDELKQKIKDQLQNQSDDTYNNTYQQKIMDELVNLSTIKYPSQMLEREVDHVIDGLKDRLAQQKLDLDIYMKTRQLNLNELREEAKPVAIKRIENFLVMMEVSKAENIEIGKEDIETETNRTLETINRLMPKKEARKYTDKDSITNLMGNIMVDLMTEQTLKRLREIASGKQSEELLVETTVNEKDEVSE